MGLITLNPPLRFMAHCNPVKSEKHLTRLFIMETTESICVGKPFSTTGDSAELTGTSSLKMLNIGQWRQICYLKELTPSRDPSLLLSVMNSSKESMSLKTFRNSKKPFASSFHHTTADMLSDEHSILFLLKRMTSGFVSY